MQYVLSVTEINRYIKEIISRDLVLSNLWVRGEISNYKYHYSGHMYFTIKDDASLLKCVMFKTHAAGLRFQPENGMKVIIRGYISLYERDGQYQLYAEEMQPDGIGSLHLAFEQLKKKLEQEGLFDAKYKKKLPFLPRTIGVVTSSTGAVIRDILHILNRRFPNVHVKLFPVAVQGESAARQIAHAIRKLNETSAAEVIIIARGGGSLEELWAFNEEAVARSIFESTIPVISAVGHETDYTIADFAADLRAPTPSAAAELVIPEKDVLAYKLQNMNTRLKNSLMKNLDLQKSRLHRLTGSTAFKQPFDRVYQARIRLDTLNKYLFLGMEAKTEREKAKLLTCVAKLDALSPLSILTRGYSAVSLKGKKTFIKSVRDVQKGDELEVTLSDGRLHCSINDIYKGGQPDGNEG